MTSKFLGMNIKYGFVGFPIGFQENETFVLFVSGNLELWLPFEVFQSKLLRTFASGAVIFKFPFLNESSPSKGVGH